jgi:hypothetical protein
MTTLNEARSAASELKRLQEAASMLPELEAQEASSAAQQRLAGLRSKTQSEVDKLYPEFVESYNVYRARFSAVIEALKACSQSFREFEANKKHIREEVDRYLGSKMDYAIKFKPGFNLYRDSINIELEAKNEIQVGNLDLPVTPSDKGLGVLDTIFRFMIQYF